MQSPFDGLKESGDGQKQLGEGLSGGRADGDELYPGGGRHNVLHRTERGGKVLLQPYVTQGTKRIS